MYEVRKAILKSGTIVHLWLKVLSLEHLARHVRGWYPVSLLSSGCGIPNISKSVRPRYSFSSYLEHLIPFMLLLCSHSMDRKLLLSLLSEPSLHLFTYKDVRQWKGLSLLCSVACSGGSKVPGWLHQQSLYTNILFKLMPDHLGYCLIIVFIEFLDSNQRSRVSTRCQKCWLNQLSRIFLRGIEGLLPSFYTSYHIFFYKILVRRESTWDSFLFLTM